VATIMVSALVKATDATTTTFVFHDISCEITQQLM